MHFADSEGWNNEAKGCNVTIITDSKQVFVSIVWYRESFRDSLKRYQMLSQVLVPISMELLGCHDANKAYSAACSIHSLIR